MIDCLSNPEWIKPQMDFLVYLQNMRMGDLEIFDKFFLSITIFGEFWLPTLICAIVYWCIDFRAGIYLFSLESYNVFLVHFFKMLACVYRPWILDSRIHPSEAAVPFAKGYSFPSGHSAMSASVLGGVSFLLKKSKFWRIFLICLIFLIGFSRLWLGVHSLQDVICGLITGFILVFALNPIIKWAEQDSERYLFLLGIINVSAVSALIYMLYFNTYRMDYISGELLVNPQKLKYVTVTAYGYALGLINGCYLCRRYLPFNPKEASVKIRIIRGILGAIGTVLLIKFVFGFIFMNYLRMRYAAPLAFLTGLAVTLIYPVIFTNAENIIRLNFIKYFRRNAQK